MAILKADNTAAQAPVPQPDWALFLDIDGTLLDIAPRPEDVHVPKDLIQTLAQAGAWLGGALAIVSGRPFEQVDRLFAPLRLPGGAGHGSALRLPDGTTQWANDTYSVPDEWRRRLNAAVTRWPGVVVEEKAHSVAIHFRASPEHENEVRQLVEGLVARDPESFEAMPGRKAIEIRHRTLTKAVVVHSLMAHKPFKGRIPVFVGDDVTDQDGFRAVEEKGGIALHVAQAFGGRPSAVRAWLKRFRKEGAN